jgi:hypothetical protein
LGIPFDIGAVTPGEFDRLRNLHVHGKLILGCPVFIHILKIRCCIYEPQHLLQYVPAHSFRDSCIVKAAAHNPLGETAVIELESA